MADHDIEVLRGEIAALLPVAMDRAVGSYRRFALGPAAECRTAREFGRHHAACRAALNHLDALVRLARWASAATGEAEAIDQGELARMVAAARRALAGYPDHPEDETPHDAEPDENKT